MRGRKAVVVQALFVGTLLAGTIACQQMDSVIEKSLSSDTQKDALDKTAQRKTVADIRLLGTAMFSWLTDQVGAAAAGQSQGQPVKRIRMDEYTPISHAELVKLLVPQYLQEVPERDGWGHPYELYLLRGNNTAPYIMSIRSPGRDGKFETGDYVLGPFDPDQFDQDIVWADGYFVRWPQRAPR